MSSDVRPDAAMVLDPWLRHQIQTHAQPGVAVAVADRGALVFDACYGLADLTTGERLTPEHRLRVASHSKSFTAAAIMVLRERGLLELSDPLGRFITGLHPAVAARPLSALLTHTAGLTRDGADSGQWGARRPFKTRDELLVELAEGPVIEPGSRFKYSNHGYAMLGMVIESVTGQAYRHWMAEALLGPLGLHSTLPDTPIGNPASRGWRLAHGHSAVWPLGRRVPVDVGMSTDALAPAGGFISTAADLARFFGGLDPAREHPLLSAQSRREMIEPRWPEPDASAGRWYGLGMLTQAPGETVSFGHAGVFPGMLSRTLHSPDAGFTVSMISNSADGLAPLWVDGAMALLTAARRDGRAPLAWQAWNGIWWSDWIAYLVLATGRRILVGQASLPNPLFDAIELAPLVDDPLRASIVKAPGLASYGEIARLVTDDQGRARELWLGGTRLLPAAAAADALLTRFNALSAPGGRA
ncbi:MAG: serine hydrolase domain-containing protein [Burkholderiaceae bacterium]